MNKTKALPFNNEVLLLYRDQDELSKCPTITFQVTDDCCLNCSYCYQKNKGHRMMNNEIMKKGIDLLFQMYDEDKPESVINHHSHGIILDFIGGEPMMNIDVIQYGSEYFINECVKRNHEWLTNFRFSMSSNGLLYFDEKVQKYLRQFAQFLSLTITIDGPKELHDACRKDFDGNGSFDRSMHAYRTLRDNYGIHPNTKVTIAPENLPYLNQIINFFVTEQSDEIHANPIYEHKWTLQEGQLYYKQLKELANNLLENPNFSTTLFSDIIGQPILSTELQNWCGGTGEMLAFDPDGIAYPCLRYMESSLGSDQPPIIIGSVNGVYQTEEEKEIQTRLKNITRRTQSTDECFNCHIASGCAWCSAWNYQQFGTCDKRSTNLCWMHRARSLANTYYWNTFYKQTDSLKRIPVYLERSIANQIISDEEYDELLILTH